MNSRRNIKILVTVSKSEIIRALKAAYPNLIDLQALPDSGLDTFMIPNPTEITFEKSVGG